MDDIRFFLDICGPALFLYFLFNVVCFFVGWHFGGTVGYGIGFVIFINILGLASLLIRPQE